METKYQQLKNRIKENAEFTRILKQHRKTERFTGERLKNVKVYVQYWNDIVKDKNYRREWKRDFIIIPELDNRTAEAILRGDQVWDNEKHDYRFYVSPSYDNHNLFTVYGILRNERKTKKIKIWEDLIKDGFLNDEFNKARVDYWREDYMDGINKEEKSTEAEVKVEPEKSKEVCVEEKKTLKEKITSWFKKD